MYLYLPDTGKLHVVKLKGTMSLTCLGKVCAILFMLMCQEGQKLIFIITLSLLNLYWNHVDQVGTNLGTKSAATQYV